MLYNQSNFTYDNAGISYSGTLIIHAASLVNPIVLNNVSIFTSANEDYSNYTTIGVLSIDVDPTGTITMEVLDKDIMAISSAQVISISGSAEVSILG